MKYGIIGDLHMRASAPRRRTDTPFADTIFRKLKFCLNVCQKRRISYLLQPGDFFDSFNINANIMYDLISILRYYRKEVTVVTIHGQHDLRYHQKNYNATPLGLLEASEAAAVLKEGEAFHPNENHIIKGCGWETEIPKPHPKKNSTLLIHKMLIDSPLWPGQDATYGSKFLTKHKYDLIVSGDNHKKFIEEKDKRFLVNPGSVVRSGIDQVTHEPAMFVWDTIRCELEEIKIHIEPIEEVFDISGAMMEKEKQEELDKFVDSLKDASEIAGLDFLKNLSAFQNENDLPVGVRTMIDAAIEYAQGGDNA